jgi:hypothetical protein
MLLLLRFPVGAAVRGVDDKSVPMGTQFKERHIRELRRVPPEQRKEVLGRAADRGKGSAGAGGGVVQLGLAVRWSVG